MGGSADCAPAEIPARCALSIDIHSRLEASEHGNMKIVALVVLLIALFGLVYSIEVTARPPSQRLGATQVDTGGE